MLKLVLGLFAMFFILLMSLIPSENNLHMCPSSDSMVEIVPYFYSNRILNQFPVLAHGLALEMRLFMLINCFYAHSSSNFTPFSSMFYVSFFIRCSSLCVFGHVSRECQKCWYEGWGVQQIPAYSVCFYGLTRTIEWFLNSVKGVISWQCGSHQEDLMGLAQLNMDFED